MMLSNSKVLNGKALFKALFLGVFALFLSAGSMQAQSDAAYPDLFNEPTGDFLAPADADRVVQEKIVQLKDLFVSMVPGTANYINTDRAIFYYSIVGGEVASGVEVPSAIVTGLNYLADQGYIQSSNDEMQALREESIDLLKK